MDDSGRACALMAINMAGDEDACACLSAFPRNPTPLDAANELWDVTGINTALVSADTRFLLHTQTHTHMHKDNKACVFTCKSVGGDQLNWQPTIFKILQWYANFNLV